MPGTDAVNYVEMTRFRTRWNCEKCLAALFAEASKFGIGAPIDKGMN